MNYEVFTLLTSLYSQADFSCKQFLTQPFQFVDRSIYSEVYNIV